MAQAVLSAIRVKISRGAAPQDAVDEFSPESSARNRVSVWLDKYMAEQEERGSHLEISPNHLRELKRHARSPDGAFHWWSDLTLWDIDAANLNEWKLWLSTERGLALKSVQNILGYFRAFVSWLYRLEKIDRLPTFPRVKVREHAPTILSPRTQGLVLDQIPLERRGAFLAACHGVRPGELRALDVGDDQERDGVPGLMVTKAIKGPNSNSPTSGTKTGEAHWIPIDEVLAEWIAWRIEQRKLALSEDGTSSPWASVALFPNPSARNPERRWISNALREEWNRAASQVGVKVKMYEGTKHSSATGWRSSGMDLEMIRRMLRHRDSRSTERYAKLADSALVEAFTRARPRRTERSE
jgi:integrase